jgi:hypothetical protein
MPLNRQWPDETREMRLVSKVIELHEDRDASLPEFIARRRLPGTTWRTWDELSFELTEVIGEIVTDGTLRRWAKRYGIPESTTAEQDDGVAKAYTAVLRKAGIVLS